MLWVFLFILGVALGQQLLVQTSSGPVQGVQLGTVNVWLGIPYAVPPVGPLRFTAPTPPAPWTQPRLADRYGSPCMQTPVPGYFPSGVVLSEDCLTVNVFAPVNASGLPVMFWIYGGAFITGGASRLTYNGIPLSRQGVVVVTFNYRLGYFGMFALNDLPFFSQGSMGFLDQQLALKWAHANVAAFGGDPSRITIFGESAGASSITMHITTPSSWPYFSQAIMESSPAFAETRPVSLKIEESQLTATLKGCTFPRKPLTETTLECLRKLNASDLIQTIVSGKQPAMGFQRGGAVPLSPYVAAVQQLKFHPGPLLVGHVANEGTLFAYGAFPRPLPLTLYLVAVPPILVFEFGISLKDALTYVEAYPCLTPADCRPVASELVGDILLRCTTDSLMKAKVRSGTGKVFSYIFSHAPSWSPSPVLGAYHASELEFVFDTAVLVNQNITQAEVQLATAMSAAWVAFAKTGTPSTLENPWNEYSPLDGRRVIINTTMPWRLDGSPSCAAADVVFANTYREKLLGAPEGCARNRQQCNLTSTRPCCEFGSECLRHAQGTCGGQTSIVEETFLCTPRISRPQEGVPPIAATLFQV